MNNFIGTAAAVAMVLTASAASAAERTVTLAVKNMTCATCGPIVRGSLARIPGVKRVDVSMTKGTATVTFDDTKANVAQLVSATARAGYPSHPQT